MGNIENLKSYSREELENMMQNLIIEFINYGVPGESIIKFTNIQSEILVRDTEKCLGVRH